MATHIKRLGTPADTNSTSTTPGMLTPCSLPTSPLGQHSHSK